MPSDESNELVAPLNWQPVTEPRIVYRFLQGREPTPEDFRSDGERDKKPAKDEHPDLLTGMSAFVSEAKARERWNQVKASALRKQRAKESERAARLKQVRPRPFRMSIGDYIGEIVLGPGAGIEIIDSEEPDGHLTIRGPKDVLAARVADVYPAETKPT
jgi:hypothetical protein